MFEAFSESFNEADFEAQLLLKRRKKARTGHSAIYIQQLKMPEMPIQNIVVTEREIGEIQRRMEREHKRLLLRSELEAKVRREKMKRVYSEI